jgi:hypothetical protein
MVRVGCSAVVITMTERLSEWFTLMHKERYCGDVYLELTFWSNVRSFHHRRCKHGTKAFLGTDT